VNAALHKKTGQIVFWPAGFFNSRKHTHNNKNDNKELKIYFVAYELSQGM